MSQASTLDILHQGIVEWNKFRDENNNEPIDLSNVDLSGKSLSGGNFQRVDFSGCKLRKTNFRKTHLKYAIFTNSDISEANFEHANAREANFDSTIAIKTRFIVTTLRKASFINANLKNSSFYRAYLRQTDFTGADMTNVRLAKAHLQRANLQDAILRNADLRSATLVGTSLLRTDLTDVQIYGVGVWDAITDGAIQKNMQITRTKKESRITSDSLETAQIISLMLDNADVRLLFNSLSSKIVLILGRFTQERKEVLDLIRTSITSAGYVGVQFDFDRPQRRGFIEVIRSLGSLSRFVIADLTDPKVVLQEIDVILTEFPSVPVRPIILKGSDIPITLLDHAQKKALIQPVFHYTDKEHLIDNLDNEIVKPAIDRAEELEDILKKFMENAFNE